MRPLTTWRPQRWTRRRQMETGRCIRRDRVATTEALGRDGCELDRGINSVCTRAMAAAPVKRSPRTPRCVAPVVKQSRPNGAASCAFA